MAETKFTPGPWRLAFDSTHACIMADKRLVVASVSRNDIYPHVVDVQDMNAHLIAAAPDMYDALNSLLKTFVEDLAECGYDEDDINDHDGVKSARLALSKAMGETT